MTDSGSELSTKKRRGFSIRIFLPDGSPDGLRIVEKSNWTGSGVICPRPLLKEMKGRPEFSRTGVYVLAGPPSQSDMPQVYIGEGDPVLPRLEQHLAKKDFWTTMICFTSKDGNLNKAHVQYLEARLLEHARGAKRCELENGNVPQKPSLSEADTAEVEGFLDEMLLCFPVLGVSIFEKPEKFSNKTIKLVLTAKGIQAAGYESPQGFVVTSGSEAVVATAPSIHPYLIEIRQGLLRHGILQDAGGKFRLTQDYVFNSPSTAAGVLLGRSANGRVEWRTKDGRTLKALQELDAQS
jgi:hypothetical protein